MFMIICWPDIYGDLPDDGRIQTCVGMPVKFDWSYDLVGCEIVEWLKDNSKLAEWKDGNFRMIDPGHAARFHWLGRRWISVGMRIDNVTLEDGGLYQVAVKVLVGGEEDVRFQSVKLDVIGSKPGQSFFKLLYGFNNNWDNHCFHQILPS